MNPIHPMYPEAAHFEMTRRLREAGHRRGTAGRSSRLLRRARAAATGGYART